jgi:hypothetical protein
VRPAPRVTIAAVAILMLAAVSVVASRGGARGEEEAFDAAHPVWRWQGPFEYVRDFGASAPGCTFHGREVVQGEMVCSGTDLRHLQCTANGTASHAYNEQVQSGVARNDAGAYQGPLQIAYDTHQTKGVELFRLDVGANLPVQYRESTGDHTAKSGKYLLDVSGSTGDLVFDAQNARLERRRVQPIYEPGPRACAVQGHFNGTETVSMRLLPTD